MEDILHSAFKNVYEPWLLCRNVAGIGTLSTIWQPCKMVNWGICAYIYNNKGLSAETVVDFHALETWVYLKW